MRQFYGFDPEPYRKYLYEHRERDAVRHVFRVASSLDSMIVGEPQILGQVKEAYATARAVGAVNSQLDALLTRAFAVAKRVRNETAIATSAVSVASVAVDLAKKIFGNLQGKSVYLVGAGKMCELSARHLVAHGAKQIYVANRTYRAGRGAGEEVQRPSRFPSNSSTRPCRRPTSSSAPPARRTPSSARSTAKSS